MAHLHIGFRVLLVWGVSFRGDQSWSYFLVLFIFLAFDEVSVVVSLGALLLDCFQGLLSLQLILLLLLFGFLYLKQA